MLVVEVPGICMLKSIGGFAAPCGKRGAPRSRPQADDVVRSESNVEECRLGDDL